MNNHPSLKDQSKQVQDQFHYLVGRFRRSTRRRRRALSSIYQPILHHAKQEKLLGEREYRFWTSRTAYFIYMDFYLAVLSRQYWLLLHGIALVLLLQISWIMLRWIVYAADDPALQVAVNFASTWIRRFAKEGEAILSGASGTKLVFAGVVTYNATTGLGYLRAILRYKMSEINRIAQIELAARKSRRSAHIVPRPIAKGVSRVSSKLSSRSSDINMSSNIG